MISYSSNQYPAMPQTLNGPTNTWTPIMYPCASGDPNRNIRSLNPFNLLIRANVKISASTAAPGAVYGVRFRLISETGVEYDGGSYIRAVRPVSGSGNPTARQPLLEQAETFNGTVHNVPAGNYQLYTDARLLSPGSITLNFAFVTAQGAPASVGGAATGYKSGKSVIASGPDVSGWAILNEITFTTDKPLNIFPQGFVQVDNGVELDPIALSLELDGVSMVSELTLAGLANEGFNVFSHFYKVQAGTHTLRLWGVNRNSRSTVMRWRQLEYVSFPVLSQSDNGAKDDVTGSILDTVSGGMTGSVITTVSSTTTEAQPTGFLLIGFGGTPWTKLATFQLPTYAGEVNWIGDAYVEFIGRGTDIYGTDAGDWSNQMVQVAVETRATDGALTDMGIFSFAVPNGPVGLSSFLDAMRWGNHNPNTVTLWIRKGGVQGTTAKFRVRKRWVGASLVPMAEPAELTNACFKQ